VYEVNPIYPAIRLIDEGIRASLENSPYELEIYREYLDTILLPDAATQQEIRAFLMRKYRNRRLDVIVTAGPGPLRFMMEFRDTAFPGVPVVFCLPNGLLPGVPAKRPDFVGIENDIAPAETLEVALRLAPATKRVVVIGGVSAFDRQEQSAVRQRLKPYENRLGISYWTDFAMPDLLEPLKHLPSHTIVLLTSVGQDAAGARFSSSQTGPLVVGAANAPVFSLADVYLNHGEVGGKVSNILEEGKVAGGMARRILDGETPDTIATVNGVNTYMFDLQALQRWGMSAENLPPGSVELNRKPSFWQIYRRYLLAGVLALVAQTFAILALLWQRAKRKKTEAQLCASRLRLEDIIETAMDAVVVFDEGRRISVFNAAAEKMFGCPARDAIGSLIDRFIPRPFHEQHSEHIRHSADPGVTIRTMGAMGVRGLRSDGQEFPMDASISQTETAGVKLFTVVIRDVTDRQLAQDALRESEERFRLVANAAPVMIWMSDTHKLCDYCNQTFLNFTGRSLEAELGEGWLEGVHADDRQNCWSIFAGAFDQRKAFAMEYRLRRHDGEYRWVLDLGVPRFNTDSSFAGYIGSAIDVTERKEAEEALSSVSRRLIEAHEEERTWIARELHDDINQRVALLAVLLRTLKQKLPPTEAEAGRFLEEAYERASELGSDIQALSHHLHSSKLDYLGLVAAAKSVCQELSRDQNVEVAFQSEYLPQDLPKEVSLCLFRVLQEALQNAVKHSRARRFEVSMTSTLTEIQLTVHDSGIGFDPESVVSDHGLGLTSMKERLKLVGGRLSVESKLEEGTTIHARVPLRRKLKSAGAVG
jgi:PAS domain S-box-containing protein